MKLKKTRTQVLIWHAFEIWYLLKLGLWSRTYIFENWICRHETSKTAACGRGPRVWHSYLRVPRDQKSSFRNAPVVARKRHLCTYLLHSNSSSCSWKGIADGRCYKGLRHPTPVSFNLLQGFIPTFALHCSIAFVYVTWVHFRGSRKGRVSRKKSSTFLPHEVLLFILLKPLWFPFPLQSPVCLFRRVEIGFVCDAPSCLLHFLCAYVYSAAIYEDDSPILRHLLIQFFFVLENGLHLG